MNGPVMIVSQGRMRRPSAYHTREACPRVKAFVLAKAPELRRITIRQAILRGLPECKHCRLNATWIGKWSHGGTLG